MTSEETKDELKQYSIKHNITLAQLKEVVYLVFKFVRTKLRSAEVSKDYFPSVRVMGLGVFFVSTFKRNKIKRLNDKKDEKRK